MLLPLQTLIPVKNQEFFTNPKNPFHIQILSPSPPFITEKTDNMQVGDCAWFYGNFQWAERDRKLYLNINTFEVTDWRKIVVDLSYRNPIVASSNEKAEVYCTDNGEEAKEAEFETFEYSNAERVQIEEDDDDDYVDKNSGAEEILEKMLRLQGK